MFRKKKTTPKENNLQNTNKAKKTSINQPKLYEELRIKTLPSIDLKNNKNNQDLHKQYSNSKKNISRKTTSRTIRLDNSLGTGYLNSLLRQVK